MTVNRQARHQVPWNLVLPDGPLYPIVYWWTVPLLYVGGVCLSFKGCWVYSVAFVLYLMENPVSEQCRP